jgi:hypothetical protein
MAALEINIVLPRLDPLVAPSSVMFCRFTGLGRGADKDEPGLDSLFATPECASCARKCCEKSHLSEMSKAGLQRG